MDEISLLRRTRNRVPERAPEDVTRGKLDLLEHIHSDSPFAPVTVAKPRRTATWVGFITLGAGALTVALVATNVLGLAGWRGGADSAAASVLESAAVATLNVKDPVLAPGQYLLIKTDAVNLYATASDSGTTTGFLQSIKGELYVPADRDDDWVWMRHAGQTQQTFGPESEAFAAQMQAYEADELLRAPGGTFYGGSPTEISGDYDSLPRDPHQLLNAIYLKTLGAGRSRDGEALVWIADTLRAGTVPADLRSALYKAAAAIPGVTITDQHATLDGTTGVSIGRVETADNTRQDIIIDPANGQFIGERQVTVNGFAGIPAGTATTSTTVTTSVTDTAPAGGTQYGNHQ